MVPGVQACKHVNYLSMTSSLSSYSWRTFHDPKIACVFSLIGSFVFVSVGKRGVTGEEGRELPNTAKESHENSATGQLWPQPPPEAQHTFGSPFSRPQWKSWATSLKKPTFPYGSPGLFGALENIHSP